MNETTTTATDSTARDRFVTDLQTLSTHAQELLHVTSTVSGEGIAAAREQLKESIRMVKENLVRMQNDAMERGRKVAQQADSYVHENPWQAMGVGLVAGLVIGLASSSAARSLSSRS
ncbi:MAG: DUF883 family protein [Panacagrimonas sp.]